MLDLALYKIDETVGEIDIEGYKKSRGVNANIIKLTHVADGKSKSYIYNMPTWIDFSTPEGKQELKDFLDFAFDLDKYEVKVAKNSTGDIEIVARKVA